MNGSPVHAASNIYQALESGQPLKMTVVRGTEHLQIKVIPDNGWDNVYSFPGNVEFNEFVVFCF